MRKSKVITMICIVASLLTLFLPIPKGTCSDGGTRDYSALTYRLIVWNRFLCETNEDGSVGEPYTYHKTSIFWFPDIKKSIDELWKIEWNSR